LIKKLKNLLKEKKNNFKNDLYQKEAGILLKKDMKHLVMEFKKWRI
jgi:hypothetical protein